MSVEAPYIPDHFSIRNFWIDLERNYPLIRAAQEKRERVFQESLKPQPSASEPKDKKQPRLSSWIERARYLEAQLTSGNLSERKRAKCQNGLNILTGLINAHLRVGPSPATEPVAELH